MNPDFSKLSREEVEMKITSMLLGELDASEAAGLREWMAKDAELLTLQRDLERTLALVREAVNQPAEPTAAAVLPRLGEARRSALLARLRSEPAAGEAPPSPGGTAEAKPGVRVVPVDFMDGVGGARARGPSSTWLALAACLIALLGAASVWMANPGMRASKSLAMGTAKSPHGGEAWYFQRLAETPQPISTNSQVASDGSAPTVVNSLAYQNARQADSFEFMVADKVTPVPPPVPGPSAGGAPRGGPAADPVAVSSASESPKPFQMSSGLMRRYGLQPGQPAEPGKPTGPNSDRARAYAGGRAAGFGGGGGVGGGLGGGAATTPLAIAEPAPSLPPPPAVASKPMDLPALVDMSAPTPAPPTAARAEAMGRQVSEERLRSRSSLATTAAPADSGAIWRDNAAPAAPAVAPAGRVESEVALKLGVAVANGPVSTAQPVDALALGRKVTQLGDRPELGQLFGQATGGAAGVTRGGAMVAGNSAPAAKGVASEDLVAEAKVNALPTGADDASKREVGSATERYARQRVQAVDKEAGVVFFDADFDSDGFVEERGRPNVELANRGLNRGEALDTVAARELQDSRKSSRGTVRFNEAAGLEENLRELAEGEALEVRAKVQVAREAAAEAALDQKTLGKTKADTSPQPARSEGRRLAVAGKLVEPAPSVDQPVVASPVEPVAPQPQPEVVTAENPFSTFSLNVSDVSFKLAGASLDEGKWPSPATVRTEEFLNAFQYRDPEPAPGMRVGFAWERARYPFAHNRDMLRFAVRTAARGREAGRPLNLVLAIDSSGSMERADRVQILREALRTLAAQLTEQDRVSWVTFARTARLWGDAVPGTEAAAMAESASSVTPEGGTNLEEALRLAYETALKHFLPNGVNRVVLLTDGAANLGDTQPEALKRVVESHRQRGVALDCFGIGWEGYNDDLLETLARNGDGRYGFVNTPEEAATGFAAQLAGALQVAASDVKVQVEFNPRRVSAWRQIGYAKHQLKKEQFRDNTVDAAELGAAETGNALYAVETLPRGDGPLATVRVRYKVAGSGTYEEHEWVVPYQGAAPDLEQASPAMRLATTSAAFAEWLASSPFATEVKPASLLTYLNGVPAAFQPDPRPARLENMIRAARTIRGE